MKTIEQPKLNSNKRQAKKTDGRMPSLLDAAPHTDGKMPSLLGSASPSLPISSSPRLPLSTSSFDPTLPLDGSLIVAGVLRDQFNGLAGEIAQLPTDTDLNNAMNNTLSNAIAQSSGMILSESSNISNSVGNLAQSAYSYYDQTQMQLVMDKIDELINTLRR